MSGSARGFLLQTRDQFQVIDEALVFPRLGVRVRQPQQIGRMHRHQRLGPSSRSMRWPRFLLIGVILPNTLCAAVAPIATTRSAGWRRVRVHTTAGMPDFRRRRFLVQADFPARHEFEVFHRVGDVDLLRSMPASTSARSSIWPAGPTKGGRPGLPCRQAVRRPA